MVVPQFNPKIGPQVLENTKGLFITASLQTQIHHHTQFQEKLKSGNNKSRCENEEIKPIENGQNSNETVDNNEKTREGI